MEYKMDISTRILACASLAIVALSSVSPAMADQQKQKNTDRNLAIGAGAVGLYGLTHHSPLLAVAGIAGGIYEGNKYEQERKRQAAESRYHRRHRRHHRHH
jgi:hypothetical protein